MRCFPLLTTGLGASLLVLTLACQRADVDALQTTDSIAEAAVPGVVKSTLSTAYPQASQTTWSKLSPTVYQADLVSQSAKLLVSIQGSGKLLEAQRKVDSTALPATVLDYLNANYAGYKILKAGTKEARGTKTVEGYFVLIRQNNQVYALSFDAKGVFTALTTPSGRCEYQRAEEKDLPAAVTDYLKTNYAGYAFEKAITLKVDGTVKGYAVLFTKDGKRYTAEFDGAGAFVRLLGKR